MDDQGLILVEAGLSSLPSYPDWFWHRKFIAVLTRTWQLCEPEVACDIFIVLWGLSYCTFQTLNSCHLLHLSIQHLHLRGWLCFTDNLSMHYTLLVKGPCVHSRHIVTYLFMCVNMLICSETFKIQFQQCDIDFGFVNPLYLHWICWK